MEDIAIITSVRRDRCHRRKYWDLKENCNSVRAVAPINNGRPEQPKGTILNMAFSLDPNRGIARQKKHSFIMQLITRLLVQGYNIGISKWGLSEVLRKPNTLTLASSLTTAGIHAMSSSAVFLLRRLWDQNERRHFILEAMQ